MLRANGFMSNEGAAIHSPSPDLELLQRLRAGDEDAIVAIYRRWQEGIYRFALHMSGSEALAEDITQEVFLMLIADSGRFDPERGSLSSYLFGISRNLVLQAFQKKHRLVALEDEWVRNEGERSGTLATPDDPLLDLTRQEGIAAVRQAILTLPEHYREVVVLCDLEEFSYAEAAEICGCPLGTIRSRLNRAHELLLNRLEKMKGSHTALIRNRAVRSTI
ncbi:MAG: sigma-70 family RNA polymerase sigma factor [Terriglobia bacterium]